MKALTIRQPWASLIALGVKTIETRSWSTSYRGPLAIHAGKAAPAEGFEVDPYTVERWRDDPTAPCLVAAGDHRRPVDLPLGAVVAVVDLLDVVPMATDPACEEWERFVYVDPFPKMWLMSDDALEADITDQLPFGDFAPGRYAWLLGNVRPLDPPQPAKGRQGLWTWEAQP